MPGRLAYWLPVFTGAYLVTPFHCADLGIIILLNRVFVPRKKSESWNMVWSPDWGTSRPSHDSEADRNQEVLCLQEWYRQNQWHYQDLETMARLPGTDPVFTDADFQSTVLERPMEDNQSHSEDWAPACTGADSVQSRHTCGLRNSYLELLGCEEIRWWRHVPELLGSHRVNISRDLILCWIMCYWYK